MCLRKLKEFSFHDGSYPHDLKEFFASWGWMVWISFPIRSHKPVTVRSAAFRSKAFSFENVAQRFRVNIAIYTDTPTPSQVNHHIAALAARM